MLLLGQGEGRAMGAHRMRGAAVLLAAVLVLATAGRADADPLPGFDFDPVNLTARMNGCLSYQVGKDEILTGWVSARTAEHRTWRCSSLRHMMRHDGSPGRAHDPFVNVADFMRCADRVVSYGFPRRLNKYPQNISLIKQYNGTRNLAIVAVNESTGDIATIYTDPVPDDRTGCARAL